MLGGGSGRCLEGLLFRDGAGPANGRGWQPLPLAYNMVGLRKVVLLEVVLSNVSRLDLLQ